MTEPSAAGLARAVDELHIRLERDTYHQHPGGGRRVRVPKGSAPLPLLDDPYLVIEWGNKNVMTTETFNDRPISDGLHWFFAPSLALLSVPGVMDADVIGDDVVDWLLIDARYEAGQVINFYLKGGGPEVGQAAGEPAGKAPDEQVS